LPLRGNDGSVVPLVKEKGKFSLMSPLHLSSSNLNLPWREGLKRRGFHFKGLIVVPQRRKEGVITATDPVGHYGA
jgi:hypothetical protein